MPPDNDDDDNDPALEQFLTDCRRFMAECPSLWIESAPGKPPALEAAEVQTDALVAEAHANRAGQNYPTADQLVANLPIVLRALCDHLLDVHPTARDVARWLASVIDAVEHVRVRLAGTRGHSIDSDTSQVRHLSDPAGSLLHQVISPKHALFPQTVISGIHEFIHS